MAAKEREKNTQAKKAAAQDKTAKTGAAKNSNSAAGKKAARVHQEAARIHQEAAQRIEEKLPQIAEKLAALAAEEGNTSAAKLCLDMLIAPIPVRAEREALKLERERQELSGDDKTVYVLTHVDVDGEEE